MAFGASTRLAFLADVVIATIVVFAVATIAVAVVGPRLARVAEAVANRLDVGHVLVGAVLLGVVTSLPGRSSSSGSVLPMSPSPACTR